MKLLSYLTLAVFVSLGLLACESRKQETSPFWSEIQNFKKADSVDFPPRNGILFIGSSSFRLWTDLETVFEEYQAINRGFGGATLIDVNHYANEIIFPYQPRQIVIYSGENDLPSDTVTAEILLDRFKTLFTNIRSRMPEVSIAYISIKPSPARSRYIPLIKQCNILVRDYLATQRNTSFINIFPLLLRKDGGLRPELYVGDKLHLNSKGYEIWEKAIAPYLLKK